MSQNHRYTHPTAAQSQIGQRFRKLSKGNSPSSGKVLKNGRSKKEFTIFGLLLVASLLPYLQGCGVLPKTEAEAQSPRARGAEQGGGVTAVDVAIAQTGVLQEPVEYTGSTRPVREVSLRSQVEGRLLNLQVDVGAPVKRGQILARLDDSILQTTVTQAQAELGALQSEVASAQTQVKNAEALAQQAKAELQQAQVDAARLRSLQQSGAISQQQAEVGQTAAATAQQKYNAAIAQIATEQQAVAAAQGRVAAQRSAVAQERERQSYALLASPITGVVLEKVTEPGNLVQPGGEILRLGDFSSVKVVVQVSDKELSNIRVGQSVQVSLDAFANQEFTGKVSRILPVPTANTTVVQIPVEIIIPNSNGRIGSQFRAQVSFEQRTKSHVVVPQTALSGAGEQGTQREMSREAKVFVVSKSGTQAKVQARPVQVGTRANGKVEILSGLRPGEQFVAQSAKPLKDGETVRLSILSKTPEKQEPR